MAMDTSGPSIPTATAGPTGATFEEDFSGDSVDACGVKGYFHGSFLGGLISLIILEKRMKIRDITI